jgi:hypothetical protein
MGYPPWLMWGTNHQVRATPTLGLGQGVFTQQLARVDYARPDTWGFFFWAQLNDFSGLAGSFCDLFFDLTIGLGRSAVRVDSFEHFRWEHDGTLPAKGNVIFSTQSQGPLRLPGDLVPNLVDDFVAQSINCVCRAVVGVGSGATVLADVTVAAMFAPRTHIRPEWYISTAAPLNTSKFRGGETGGT